MQSIGMAGEHALRATQLRTGSGFLAQLDALADRVISGRIIAKALIDMRGSTVKAVFEAATQGKLFIVDWRRRELQAKPLIEELHVTGCVKATGETLSLVSLPFENGLVDEASAALGRTMLEQSSQWEFAMPGIDLKIKGLTEIITQARVGITSVRDAAKGVGESARAFVDSAADLKKQIDAAHDDLKFEATQLGNSSPASEGTSETQQG